MDQQKCYVNHANQPQIMDFTNTTGTQIQTLRAQVSERKDYPRGEPVLLNAQTGLLWRAPALSDKIV